MNMFHKFHIKMDIFRKFLVEIDIDTFKNYLIDMTASQLNPSHEDPQVLYMAGKLWISPFYWY